MKLKNKDIHIRDPFVLVKDGVYYMYGTRGVNFGQQTGGIYVYKGTDLEKAENRHVSEVAGLLLNSCAYHYMKNMLTRMGVSADCFKADIL